jgi:tight adherence protein B
MRRLLRAAEPRPSNEGLALDLLAVAALGGGAPETAATLVISELERAGLDAPQHRLDSLVRLSRRAGAPLGELARTEAEEVRANERAEARVAAERLAVRLMLPLGACVLPSFLLLGVVPMLLGLLSSTAQVF